MSLVNATQICNASGCSVNVWKRIKVTRDAVAELARKLNIAPESLIQSSKSNGTWIHPELESNLKEWIASCTTDKKEIEVYEFRGVKVELDKRTEFVNATTFCANAGKEFRHWLALKQSKTVMKKLRADLEDGSGVETQLIVLHLNRQWIHPDLSIPLAEWLFPEFALQVSRWIQRLLRDRTVSLVKDEYEAKLIEIRIEAEEKVHAAEEKARLAVQQAREEALAAVEKLKAAEDQLRSVASRSVPVAAERLLVFRSTDEEYDFIVKRVQSCMASYWRRTLGHENVVLDIDSPNAREVFSRFREEYAGAAFRYNSITLREGEDEEDFLEALLAAHDERLGEKRHRDEMNHV